MTWHRATRYPDDNRLAVDSGEALDTLLLPASRMRPEVGVAIEVWVVPSTGRRGPGTGITLASMDAATAHELGGRLLLAAERAGWEEVTP